MKKYTISFTGKERNAIGISSKFTVTVEAEDEDKAILKLYDKFDHIQMPKIIKVTESSLSKAQEFLNETSQVVKVFKGEENTEVQVTKILNGYSVTVRDLDSGKLLPTSIIYKDSELDKAIQAAKDIAAGKNPAKSKGYVNV